MSERGVPSGRPSGPRAMERLSIAALGSAGSSTSDVPAPSAGSLGPLVGREREAALLDDALTSAAAGALRTVLVSGEAGIGKSRLAKETALQAQHRGFDVLEGSSMPGDETFALGLFIDLIRQRLAQTPDAVRGVLGPQAAALAGVIPELPLLVPPLEGPPTVPSDGASTRLAQRFLFEAIVAILRRLSTRQPVLLVFENLHWSDPTSLELLELLPRRLNGRRLMVLATIRSDEDAPLLVSLTARLRNTSGFEPLRLAGLSDAAIETIARASNAGSTYGDVAERIRRRAAGNPLFAEELAAAGEPAWIPVGRVLPVPDGVADLVLRRVDTLDPDAREVLDVASVIGSAGERSTLQRVLNLAPERLDDAIDRLAAARLIEGTRPSAWQHDSWRFRHELTRDAVYGRLTTSRRRALHVRVAEALEKEAGDEHSRADVLAHHLYESGEWARALPLALAAADRARRLHAVAEAAAHDSRALEAAIALRDERAAALHERVGEDQALLGDYDGAAAHFEEAIRLAGTTDENIVQRALDGLSALAARRDYAEAERLARESLALARAIGDGLRVAHALNRLGNVLVNRLQFVEGRALHEEALREFTAAADEWGIADTNDLIAMARFLGGEVAETRLSFAEAARAFERLNDVERAASSLATAGTYITVTEAGIPTDASPQAFEVEARRSLELSRDLGWRAGEAYALAALSADALGDGRIRDARRLANEAELVASSIGHDQWRLLAVYIQALIDVEVGAWEAAKTRLATAESIAIETRSAQWRERVDAWIAAVAVLLHEPAGRERLLAAAPRKGHAPATIGERRALLSLGELALDDGDAVTAHDLTESLARGDRLPSAAVLLLRGRALGRLGETAAASSDLEAAWQVAGSVGPVPLVWRIGAARAALWSMTDPVQAEEERGRARDALRGLLDRAGDADRAHLMHHPHAQSLLRRRGRTRTSVHVGAGGLSEREREVAQLVGSGLRNKEIAARLGISEKTVEMHVSSALSKIGRRSRVELAAWVVGSDAD